MSEQKETAVVFDGQDIVFDCRYCGKSLVINSRGAGLMIQCPGCQAELEVPTPEEAAMTDERSEPDDAGTGAPPIAAGDEYNDAQIRELITELDELRFRRQFLERKQSEYDMCLRAIGQQMTVIRRAVDQIDELLLSMSETPLKETQNTRKV